MRYSRSPGFARQWALVTSLAKGRATTAQLSARSSVTPKTTRRDLAIISRVFTLYRDRVGPLVYWTMSPHGAEQVRVLLRRQRNSTDRYPVIVRSA